MGRHIARVVVTSELLLRDIAPGAHVIGASVLADGTIDLLIEDARLPAVSLREAEPAPQMGPTALAALLSR